MLNPIFANDIRQTLDSFRRSFDQLFDSFAGFGRRTSEDGSEWAFSPVVESGWTDDYLNLRVVIPGVTQNDLKVTVQGNTLMIRGERKAPEGFGKEGYVYHQIPYGKFERAIDLPNGLDLDKLNCHLHDGVLDVHIPLSVAMKPKHIPISTGERKAIAA